MPHLLQNGIIEVRVDLPGENYRFSRFDQTGKIVKVRSGDIRLSGIERTDAKDENDFGKGFYNEFGIDSALGFEEAEVGGWFHKIGVGLLKKEDPHYLFSKKYTIQPARFDVVTEPDRILISCHSASLLGYAYVLKKEISLQQNSFTIRYHLQNLGEKTIVTDEYVHNFMSVNHELTGADYRLQFPFRIQPGSFGEIVNPEGMVDTGSKEITFKGTPEQQFFYSNLNGNETVKAGWTLLNSKWKTGISESGSFQTSKVNLWGWRHVISPELFYEVQIPPGQSAEWSRTYRIFSYEP